MKILINLKFGTTRSLYDKDRHVFLHPRRRKCTEDLESAKFANVQACFLAFGQISPPNLFMVKSGYLDISNWLNLNWLILAW